MLQHHIGAHEAAEASLSQVLRTLLTLRAFPIASVAFQQLFDCYLAQGKLKYVAHTNSCAVSG